MALSITKLMQYPSEPKYNDRLVMNEMEMHMTYLREDPSIQIAEITPALAYKRKNDFYGLLVELGVRDEYLWVTTRVNGLNSSMAYDGSFTTIKLSPTRRADEILNRFMTKRK